MPVNECVSRIPLHDLFHNCFDQLQCLFPEFDKDDHEDIVGDTANLTNVDGNK